jgi:hypothetical protein
MGARARELLPSAVALVVAVVLFARSVGHGLLDWDDHLTIAGNPAFQPADWQGLLSGWTGPYLALWTPLTHTVWWLLAALGSGPGGYHAVSVLCHGLASAVVARLALLAVRADGGSTSGSALLAATLGGVLFAVHPAQVESVAWASGLKDVLAGLLGWTAVWVLAERAGGGGGGGPLRAGVAAVVFALALLAKPSAVAFPIAGGVLLALAHGMAWRKAAMAAAVGLLLAIPVAIVAKAVQPPNDVFVPTVGQRVLVAGDVLAVYCRRVVVPWPLAVDLARPPQVQVREPLLAVMGLVPLCVLAAAWAADRAWRERERGAGGVFGGVVAAFVLVAPVLGLVPFQYQRYSTVADHYLYPALGAVAVAAAVLVGRLLGSRSARRWTMMAAAVALPVYAAASWVYLGQWSDTRTLFEHNRRWVPESFAAERVLGFLAARRGEDELAEGHFRRAIELRGDDVETRYNLANLHLRRRDLELAREGYLRVLELRPGLEGALNNLAITYELLGQPERAREVYVRLLAVSPGNELAERGVRRTGMPTDRPQTGPASAPTDTTGTPGR